MQLKMWQFGIAGLLYAAYSVAVCYSGTALCSLKCGSLV